jgi:hypothetical protein
MALAVQVIKHIVDRHVVVDVPFGLQPGPAVPIVDIAVANIEVREPQRLVEAAIDQRRSEVARRFAVGIVRRQRPGADIRPP